MKKSYYILAFALTGLLGACGGGGEKADNGSADSTANALPAVKLQTVTARSVAQIQEYTATVEPQAKNQIAPAMPVRISRIFVEVGDRVARGQRLVQMDASNLQQMELQTANARAEFARVDELYKVGGVSKSNWDAAKMNLDVRETSLNNLRENTSLVSPISGVVTARNYDNGDMYTGAMPVLTIEQISPVKLVISVSETYFTQVKKGTPATVKIDVYENETFEGEVSLVHPTLNPATRTFEVEVTLKNQDMRVRPGMFARVTLDFGTQERVVVPDVAIVKQAGSGDRYIYVYKDGKVSYVKVELGRRMEAEFELISGIENGAQVVVAGQSRLKNGDAVTVTNQ